MVSPSGVNRAVRTSPRRNVIRRNCGSGGASFVRCAHIHAPYAAPAIDTKYSSASNTGDTPRFGFINGRAVVCDVRSAAVADVADVADVRDVAGAALRKVGAFGSGSVPVTGGRAMPPNVPPPDIAASVSRLNERSRAC